MPLNPIAKPVQIIRHEAVPKTGSYEVRFADGRPSRYFYFDDVASRRLRPGQMTDDEARDAAKAYARTMRAGQE